MANSLKITLDWVIRLTALLSLQKVLSMALPPSGPHEIMLESYLLDCIQSIRPHRMPISGKHREMMIRCLVGVTKTEYKAELKKKQTELIWRRCQQFAADHLNELELDEKDAPKFSSTKPLIETYRKTPLKYFTTMAGGRVYRGQFEYLLRGTIPEALDAYRTAVRDPGKDEVLRAWIADQRAGNDHNVDIELCLNANLPPAPRVRVDGGNSLGKQGEVGLREYLGNIVHPPQEFKANVLVKPKPSTNEKSTSYIHVPRAVVKEGMTGEFDALVYTMNEKAVKLDAVWDAKTVLNPCTVYDVINKKIKSLKEILAVSDTTMVLDSREWQIDATSPVSVGIFSSFAHPPAEGVRHLQNVMCEHILSTDATVVKEALKTGYVTAPEVKPKLEELLLTVQDFNVTVFVKRMLG